MSAFAGLGYFQHLRELVIDNCVVNSTASKYLARADFPALAKLAFMAGVRFAEAKTGFATWKQAKWVGRIKELKFDLKNLFAFNKNATEAFMKLCKLQWSELETFVWNGSDAIPLNEFRLIHPDGLVLFVYAAGHFPKLQTMDVGGLYTAEVLAKLCKFPCLSSLLLGKNCTIYGPAFLCFNRELPNLKVLDLEHLYVYKETFTKWLMSMAGNMPVLEELSGTALNEEQVQAVVAVLRGDAPGSEEDIGSALKAVSYV